MRGEPKLHAAACSSTQDDAIIVGETILSPGIDLVVGGGPPATLIVPGWTAPPLLVISAGQLHLGPGMRVNMCGEKGEDRIVGTYDELLARGVTLPITIARRRMTIRVAEGLSVFAKYVHDRDEAAGSAC